jgi:hypothetical protein
MALAVAVGAFIEILYGRCVIALITKRRALQCAQKIKK